MNMKVNTKKLMHVNNQTSDRTFWPPSMDSEIVCAARIRLHLLVHFSFNLGYTLKSKQ